MNRSKLIFVCYMLLFISKSYAVDIAQENDKHILKNNTLSDYFPLAVGNKWIFEVDTRFQRDNMGFPTIYNRRGELTIEIVNSFPKDNNLIIYQTSEHFIGIEKQTQNIGSRTQKDTAITFDQYRQLEIREQISGLYSYGSIYINVDTSHFVEYSNGSFNLPFGFTTRRYFGPETKDTLKIGINGKLLKNTGPIYYTDLLGGQGTHNFIRIQLIRSEIQNTTRVISSKNEGERTFQINQNYPNPFNSSTVVKFSLSTSSHITLKVVSLLGQEVATLVDQSLLVGDHTVTWYATDLSNGIYYFIFKADGFQEVRKAVLMK